MRIKSSISIDVNSDKSAILTLQKDAGTISTFTYSNKDKCISLSAREQLILNREELKSYIEQFYNFNNALLNNFSSLKMVKDITGSKIEWYQELKLQQNKLDFSFSKDNLNIIELSSDLGSNKITVAERKKEAILSYPEWTTYLYLLNFYKNRLT